MTEPDPLYSYGEAAVYLTEQTGVTVTARSVRTLVDNRELATERIPGTRLDSLRPRRGVRRTELDRYIRRARTINGQGQ